MTARAAVGAWKPWFKSKNNNRTEKFSWVEKDTLTFDPCQGAGRELNGLQFFGGRRDRCPLSLQINKLCEHTEKGKKREKKGEGMGKGRERERKVS